MLNRLFIVIGVLAILAIAAAFIVPRFLDGEFYRARMQAIAGEALGAPVEIVGDIQFSLLPQPQFDFADVKVGDPANPTLKVAEVEAQLSLLDLLRDRYVITKLILVRPAVAIGVSETGGIETGIVLAEKVTSSNVAVTNAQIVDGTLVVDDRRSKDTFTVSAVEGELRMDALRGPFAFQGSGTYNGQAYSSRISSSALDASDVSQLSLFVAPKDETFSMTVEGALTTGAVPAFSGTMTYRQKPPPLAITEKENEDAGRGDFVVTGKLAASAEDIELSEYTIVPDENRAAARLTGKASATLGLGHAFKAEISGGVLALPPRDATADPSTLPYELVQLLNELPLPPEFGIGGDLEVKIAELNLRAVSLRDIAFIAKSDGRSWTISDFKASLPGDTTLTIQGDLTVDSGKPTFIGAAKLVSERLDALSALWRKPADGNPLFNVPGSLEARVSLVGETLSVSDATVTVEDRAYTGQAEIGFASATRHLNVKADLGTLTPLESAQLAALLPEAATDNRFGVTFPQGRFDVVAAQATINGLDGAGLVAKGTWDGGVLALDTFTGELGGVTYDAKVTAFGTFLAPELSGTAHIGVASAAAPGLAWFFDTVGTPTGARAWLSRALPADLEIRLDAPNGEGGQGMGITGKAGVADLTLDAQFGVGVVRALSGPMNLKLKMVSADPDAFTAQLGLGNAGIVPQDGSMQLVAVVDGTAANSFETTIQIEGSKESLGFSGNVIAGNLEAPSGNGTIKAALTDLSALTESLGAQGIWLPALNGSARVDFNGFDKVKLSEISATSGGQRVTGALDWASGAVTGALTVAGFEPQGLLSLLAGPAATINSGVGYWPDGPVEIGTATRPTTGRIDITAPLISVGGTPVVTDATFGLTWDGTGARIRDFAGTIGGGKATAELTLCCAGVLPQKQLSGRMTLTDVALSSLVPKPVGDAIGATIDVAAVFSGTGDSFYSAMTGMNGEGSYTFDGIDIKGFAPTVFSSITTLDEVLDLEPDAVTAKVTAGLEAGSFKAPSVSGSFTIAGGVLRSPNLAISGEGARLFGSTTVRFGDLGLSGGFVMSPLQPSGPEGMLTEANANVAADFAGTLPNPVRTFNVSGMVDTIMVRAYEIEVARLEQIRAEEEARAAAAAAEKKRLEEEAAAKKKAEEEAAAKKAADEAAAKKKAEEEAAAKKAADEAAAKKAADDAAAKKAADEAAAKKAADDAAAKKAADEAAAKKKADEEAARRAAAEREAEEQPASGGIVLKPGFNLGN